MKELIFGYYAWEDIPEKRRVKEAGSGIMVGRRLGLGAKHVSKSFHRLDPQFDAIARRRTPLDPQYHTVTVRPEYAARAYQITGEGDDPPEEKQPFWQILVDWPSPDSDISVLRLEPRSEAAEALETRQRYFDWFLLPPPIGSFVSVYGFPDANIEIEDVDHRLELSLEMYPARVIEHIYPIESHGFSEFPSFRLNRSFAHGFSGGPVLWNVPRRHFFRT